MGDESDCRSTQMSSDEDELCAAWAVGDKCLVKWSDAVLYPAKVVKFQKKALKSLALVVYEEYSSEEDEWVDINLLRKRKSHSKVRKEDSDVEIVEPLEKSFFAPLHGDEAKQRIEEKFKYLEEGPIQIGPSTSADRRWPTTDKKLVPDTRGRQSFPGGTTDKKLVPDTRGRQPSPGRTTSRTRQKLSVTGGGSKTSASNQNKAASRTEIKEKKAIGMDTLDLVDELSEDGSEMEAVSQQHGFCATDLERPYFSHIQSESGPLEPLVLCAATGNQPAIQVPATINRYLRDYQRDGVKFLYGHYSQHQGALLADDMGLGKTVQVIAVIAALLGRTGTKADILARRPEFIRKLSDPVAAREEGTRRKPFLVIGPASVLYNWIDEFNTWGYFTVGKYHRQYKAETLSSLRRQKLDVVVTTYETFRDNVDELKYIEWEAVFADEVHKIKGLRAEVTQALRQVGCPQRFGLTGTPLQNSVNELWSLLDWCNPGCLGTVKEFKHKYGRVIEKGQKHNATKRELAEARTAQENLAKPRDKWMLRRLKTLIKAQLPTKSEQVVYCRATELQASVYKAVLDLEHMAAVLKQGQPCPCGSHRQRGRCCHKFLPNGKTIWAMTMSYMHLLLKAANHIALLLPKHTDNENQRKESKKICETVFASHPQFLTQTQTAAYRTLSDPKFCGKMKVLQGLLSVFKKQKSKVLLFSYSTRLLDVLETYVMSMGYEFSRLDGQTKEQTRVQLVKDFNSDPNIFLFLISTKAGGVGLNLTGADVVIIYDPNWNPTHDLQAQDRAYRIGQRRNVRVYRLITSGTIEENIYLRQLNKQLLGDVAVGTKNSKRLFYKNELFGIESMFHFRTGDRCLTEDILERHSKIEEGLKAQKTPRDRGLEDFHIVKYVPPAEHSRTGEEEGGDESDLSGPGTDDGSDSETGGVGDVTSQLMQELETSPLSPSGGSRGDSGTSHKPPSGGRTHTTRDRNVGGRSESQVDDFLEDLLDLGPKGKSPKIESSLTHSGADRTKHTSRNLVSDSEADVEIERKRVCKRDIPKDKRKSPREFDSVFDEIWAGLASKGDSRLDYEHTDKTPENISQVSKSNVFLSRSEERERNVLDDLLEEMDFSEITPTRGALKNAKPPRSGSVKNSSTVARKGEKMEQKLGSPTKGGPFKNTRSAEVVDTVEEARNKESAKLRNESQSVSKDIKRDRSPLTFLAEGATMDSDFGDFDVTRASRPKKWKGKTKNVKRKTVKFIVDSGSEAEQGSKFQNPQSSEFDATFGSVTDVFAQCGVVHTHHNRRVTAASKAEDHMSRCAIKDVYERHCDTQVPAIQCQPRAESSGSAEESFMEQCPPKASRSKSKAKKPEKTGKKSKPEKKTGFFHGPRSVLVGRRKVLIGQTPKAIRKAHFQQLADFNKKSPKTTATVAFAEKVLKLLRAQQIALLKTYYTSLDPDLEEVIQKELQTEKS